RSHRNLAVVAWRLSEGLPITDERTAPEDWIEDYLERVIAALPSKQRIYDSFEFDWTMAEIPVPDEAVKQVKLEALARDQARLDRELESLGKQRERLQSRAEYEALREVERARYDAERAQLDKQMAEARLEREKVQRDLQIQKEIGQRTKARIENAITPALDEITSSVRKMLYEATLNSLAAVRSNGKLPPQSSGAIKKLIERANDLNWQSDAQIDTYLAQLREIATEMSSSSSGLQAEAALKEAAWQLRLDLSDLGRTVRSGRSLEIEALDMEIGEGQWRVERDQQDMGVPLDIEDAMEQRQERNPIL
ncbi:MAG TPA: hypothetical protein VKQ72_05105, partial [Aggregatilineales bacterium]|nr:hypothetical protein [Aggregatilineales bacterium]